jgi:AraC family transcriptional activator of pobA
MEIVPRFFLYGEAEQAADVRFLHIETLASRSTRYQRRIVPHRHSALVQLFLVTNGAGTLLVDGATRRFAAPSLLTMPPSVIHGFEFNPGTEGWVLTLAEGFAAEVLRQISPNGAARALTRPLVLPIEPATAELDRLARYFEDIATEMRWKPVGWAASLSALLGLIFIAVLRLQAEDLAPDDSLRPDAKLFTRFRTLIESWYVEHRPISDYAGALGITEKRLNQLCRQIADATPTELIHARLAIEAERGLRYGRMTIAALGYTLGFRDPAYFSRFFRRRFGVAPREFLESIGRDAQVDGSSPAQRGRGTARSGVEGASTEIAPSTMLRMVPLHPAARRRNFWK